jgi:hypothetical protein
MSQHDLEKLEQVDLTSLTITDVVSLKNDVMRRALIEVISVAARPPEHTSHAAHSNHSKSIEIGPVINNPILR